MIAFAPGPCAARSGVAADAHGRQHLLARHEGAAQFPQGLCAARRWSSTPSRSRSSCRRAAIRRNCTTPRSPSSTRTIPSCRGASPTPSCRRCSRRPNTSANATSSPMMNSGAFTFVIDIPPNFERDVLGQAPARPADRRRRDRHGAGGPRLGLCATDRDDGDRRFPLATAEGVAAVARQSRGPHRLQPERHDRLVHQRHGHHQQYLDARHHSGRRRDRARARAWHDGPSACHAADALRDRDVEGLGQRARHHDRGRRCRSISWCAAS